MERNPEPTIIEVNDLNLGQAFIGVQAAANKKAENIKILDLRELSGFTNFFMVCTGYSDKQVQAIADSIAIELKEEGFAPISLEGYREGRWVVLDYGGVVFHIFLDALRDFYKLEELWTEARRVPIPSELYITSTQH